MSALRLNHTSFHKMKVHAMVSYPEECCGFLFGISDRSMKTVCDILEMRNRKEEERTRRYLITADDYRLAEQRAAQAGVDLLGLYHSHPNQPAEPSQFDLDHALPAWSYIILSVDNAVATNVSSWILRDDRSSFSEEQVEVVDGEFVHRCAEP